ncbi:hypothetical protein JXA88_02685 [Candidatus Fermentibacteria bacterium]|nr:hypothetical protein [Candidatus Fermentibacteria bacterium]
MRAILIVALILIGAAPLSAAPPEEAAEVTAHLEFFGYEVTPTDEVLRAVHASNLNIAVKAHRGGMLLLSFLGSKTPAEENRAQLLEFANDLNVNASVSRSYIDKDGDLALEAWFPGTYDKTRFSLFLEEWHRDTIMQRMFQDRI